MAKSAKKDQAGAYVKLLKKPKRQIKRQSAELVQLRAQLDQILDKTKEKKKAKADKIGSARGVESMFRSSYRAQLDMIALAATKANIMISLNGLLVSMLLLSGAYLLSAEPLILIPVSLLLMTCTVAIIFAVLAARPDVDNRKQTLDDFQNGDADMLIFEQFSKLSSEEFDTAMWDMLKDHERIYHNMISHIYDMGRIADKKFARLHISYNAFMIGLVVSVGSLIAVLGYSAIFKV